MTPRIQKILFYDYDASGHHSEFLAYQLRAILQREQTGDSFFFLIHPNAIERLVTQYRLDWSARTDISIYAIDMLKSDAYQNIFQRIRLEDTQILQPFVRQYGITSVVFQFLDLYAHRLFGRFWHNSALQIQGIFFQLPYRMQLPKGIRDKQNLKTLLSRARKYYIFSLLNRFNPQVKNIFVLNDAACVAHYNQRFKNSVFRYLPDPISDERANDEFQLRQYFNIATDRKILLIFGYLTERKNVLAILAALSVLGADFADKLTLLILAEGDKTYYTTVEQAIQILQNQYPALQIVCEKRFFSNAETENIFAQSDVILIAYIHFYGSSGILGHAAKYGKPLIGSQNTLIGDLITQYQLGFCVDPTDITDLAKEIQNAITYRSNHLKNNYLAEHSSALFANTLLENILSN
jgi:glycosyltransferase involved in cell wall biosynthesis